MGVGGSVMWFGFGDKTFFFGVNIGCVFTRTILITISDKTVETLGSNRVTSENKRIDTTSLSPPFNIGVFIFPFEVSKV